jgi:hypothetical protein
MQISVTFFHGLNHFIQIQLNKMTKKQKFTKELLNTPPEYLINFKQELSKLEKNTLSKLLGQELKESHKRKKFNTFFYCFSKEDLTYQEFLGISTFQPIKLIIYSEDLKKFENSDPLIKNYSWLNIVGDK